MGFNNLFSSDNEGRKMHQRNRSDNEKRSGEGGYSSSMGSTKDRDNSQSSSVNSKTDNDSVG